MRGTDASNGVSSNSAKKIIWTPNRMYSAGWESGSLRRTLTAGGAGSVEQRQGHQALALSKGPRGLKGLEAHTSGRLNPLVCVTRHLRISAWAADLGRSTQILCQLLLLPASRGLIRENIPPGHVLAPALSH